MKSTTVAFAILFLSFVSETFAQFPITYSTPGTYNWTVPVCVTSVRVKVYGAGGGGGGTSSRQDNTGEESCTEAGGGGGGAYAERVYTVVAGENYTIVVGAGGSGGTGTDNNAVASNGASGGMSTFSGPATAIPGTLTANGGGFGGGASHRNTQMSGWGSHEGMNGTGGAGGTGLNGTINRTGGNGSAGSHSAGCNDMSGAGGGGAGTGANGTNGQYIGPCPHSAPMQGGAGAATGGGNGANGVRNTISSLNIINGSAGNTYGGGGGGGGIHMNSWANQWRRSNGGAGANGAVIIEYVAGCLAVDLEEFEASCNESREVMLNWTTNTEFNSDYFVLERSVDGREWTEISKVKSVGNSTVKNEYSTLDNDVFKFNHEVLYYRLKQVDNDGVQTIHPFISTLCEFDINAIEILPNPASDNIQLLIDKSEKFNSDVFITDVHGKVLKTISSQQINQNNVIHIENFNKGIYFVKYVNHKNEQRMARFIKE